MAFDKFFAASTLCMAAFATGATLFLLAYDPAGVQQDDERLQGYTLLYSRYVGHMAKAAYTDVLFESDQLASASFYARHVRQQFHNVGIRDAVVRTQSLESSGKTGWRVVLAVSFSAASMPDIAAALQTVTPEPAVGVRWQYLSMIRPPAERNFRLDGTLEIQSLKTVL